MLWNKYLGQSEPNRIMELDILCLLEYGFAADQAVITIHDNPFFDIRITSLSEDKVITFAYSRAEDAVTDQKYIYFLVESHERDTGLKDSQALYWIQRVAQYYFLITTTKLAELLSMCKRITQQHKTYAIVPLDLFFSQATLLGTLVYGPEMEE